MPSFVTPVDDTRSTFAAHCTRARGTRAGLIALLAVASVSVSPALAGAQQVGTWALRGYPDARTATTIELRLETRDGNRNHDENSFDIPVAQLAGLTLAQLTGPDANVSFQLVRDAGTFTCQGRTGLGRGAGTFDFAPNPRFTSELSKRGYERPTEAEQFRLALADVGYALVDELAAEAYTRPTISELVELGDHGVDADFTRGMSALGYRLGSVDRLMELRDHGVAPDFIRALSQAGYTKLSSRQLLELRDHGVTPHYIADLTRIGFSGLSTADLLEARDHGVTTSWAEEFQHEGYTHVTLQELVELRDHGVSPQFVDRVRKNGEPLPSVRELIDRRDRGDRD